MSKTIIAGDAVVVASSLKLEEIKTVNKYRPDELILKGGEDGKEPIFAIGITDGPGSISDVGVSFGREANDGSHQATVTVCLPTGRTIDDVKEYVADTIGGALAKLNKLEAHLPQVLEEIEDEKNGVLRSISVAQ